MNFALKRIECFYWLKPLSTMGLQTVDFFPLNYRCTLLVNVLLFILPNK